jgi:hypothetical protein
VRCCMLTVSLQDIVVLRLVLLTRTYLVLVTGQLSKEISEILADIGQLFGVLSEDVLQMA